MSTNINESNIFQVEKKITIQKNLPSYLNQVFLWMTFALALSGITSVIVAHQPTWSAYILNNPTRFTGLLLLQLAMVFTFRMVAKYFNLATAILYYALYAVLTGLTATIIFQIFSSVSIIAVFFATSFAYSGLSIYGYMTKRDLRPIGSFCVMGLFGLVAVVALSLFFPQLQETTTQHIISCISVIVFAGFTAYDVQRIKLNYTDELRGNERSKKALINGLSLYINFINLFFDLLDLLGGRK